MSNKIIIAILIFSISIIFSCEYEPKGVFERDVKKVVPLQPAIINLNLVTDSIYIYQFTQFNFFAVPEKTNIKSIEIILDGKVEKLDMVSNFQRKDVFFNIDYQTLTEGNHTLELNIYEGSGTGSIADNLGSEIYKFSRKWIVVVDKSFTNKIKTKIENGLLKISWPKSKSYNFQEYMIRIEKGFTSNKDVKIGNDNFYIDETYFGEGAKYSIFMLNSDNNSILLGQFELKREIENLKIKLSNNKYSINWNENKYFGALEKVEFHYKNNFQAQFKVVEKIKSLKDTVYNIEDSNFMDLISATLIYIPKKVNVDTSPNYSSFNKSHLNFTSLGVKFSSEFANSIYGLIKKNNSEFMFLEECRILKKYSIPKKQIIDTYEYNQEVCFGCKFKNLYSSPNGNYTSYIDGCPGFIEINNSEKLNEVKRYTFKALDYSDSFLPITISDNGIGIYSTFNGYNLFDFSQNKLIEKISYFDKEIKQISISADGKFISVLSEKLKIFELRNERLNLLWESPETEGYNFVKFDNIKANRIFLLDKDKRVKILNCSNLSEFDSYTFEDIGICDLDFNNNEMLTYSNNLLIIRNIYSGELVSKLNVSENIYWQDLKYINGLILGNGIYHNVK